MIPTVLCSDFDSQRTVLLRNHSGKEVTHDD